MATLTRRSRHYGWPVVNHVVYANGVSDWRTYLRIDPVFDRRYTSWTPDVAATPYVTEPGDTLDRIAHSLLGDPALWWTIADINPEFFDPFDVISVGSVMLIPSPSFMGLRPSEL